MTASEQDPAEMGREQLVAHARALKARNLHLETTITASLGEQVAKVASLERELELARHWNAEARAVAERDKRRLATTGGRVLTVAELMENALHDLANAKAAKQDALEAYERIRLRAGSLERELALRTVERDEARVQLDMALAHLSGGKVAVQRSLLEAIVATGTTEGLEGLRPLLAQLGEAAGILATGTGKMCHCGTWFVASPDGERECQDCSKD